MIIDYSPPDSGKTLKLKKWFLTAPKYRGIVVHTHQRAINLTLEIRRMDERRSIKDEKLPYKWGSHIISFIDYLKGGFRGLRISEIMLDDIDMCLNIFDPNIKGFTARKVD